MSRKVFNTVFVANSSKCEITLNNNEYNDGNIIAITNENYNQYFNFSLMEASVVDIILNISFENEFGYAKSNSFIFPMRVSKAVSLAGTFIFSGFFIDENNIRTSFSIETDNKGELIGEANNIEIIDLSLENQE